MLAVLLRPRLAVLEVTGRPTPPLGVQLTLWAARHGLQRHVPLVRPLLVLPLWVSPRVLSVGERREPLLAAWSPVVVLLLVRLLGPLVDCRQSPLHVLQLVVPGVVPLLPPLGRVEPAPERSRQHVQWVAKLALLQSRHSRLLVVLVLRRLLPLAPLVRGLPPAVIAASRRQTPAHARLPVRRLLQALRLRLVVPPVLPWLSPVGQLSQRGAPPAQEACYKLPLRCLLLWLVVVIITVHVWPLVAAHGRPLPPLPSRWPPVVGVEQRQGPARLPQLVLCC